MVTIRWLREQIRQGKTIYDLPLRVTFYARVSTEKVEQQGSLENQIQYYTEFIQKNPNWTYVPGYIERYWVSVSNGLLCAAEKLQGEDVVYRMAGMSVDSGNVAEDAFTLPDGTVLHESALDGANR